MKAVILLLACLVAPPVHANPIALASASLDWSHWAFTVSSGVVVSDVVFAMPPYISAQATPTVTTDAGMSLATASVVDGMFSTRAQAQATDISVNLAQARTLSMIDFWLYGSGLGTVTVSVPYAMQAICTTQGIRDTASSSAGVWLEDGPGVRANGFQSANLGCGSGSALSGVLTVSRDVDTAYGPLVDFMAGTQTMAFATVPDLESTGVLMAIGVIGLVLMGRKAR